ncbi:MAG: ATP-grasp domain-containing protein, partial [Planctomycetota bacterium]|nr:ATP-grasp domain-containing protein [Planctomycetota bacterium]
MSELSIRKVLVANRGEIALRVIRTCRVLGIATVAVYSEADAEQRHVMEADEAVLIGPAEARASYLDVARVIEAARSTGADALHPGYGFLSENATLARACADAGIAFVGPPADVLEASADKLTVKRRVAAAGVAVIPGPLEPVAEDRDALAAAAKATGYPLLLKASAGGGGKGMRRVDAPADLQAAAEGARREAGGAFGSTELYLERIIASARHVEVQIVADAAGTVAVYGCRDCSMQRRNQKVLEESPAPGLDVATLQQAASKAARALDYRNAGTVEFLVGPDGTILFLELNRRLQVEHPVTEMVHGIDLVALQLRVADGYVFPADHAVPPARGHAMEARVYAEDPAAGFMPSPGTLLLVEAPEGPGIRVDAAWRTGMRVTPHYDPMLAKIIAHGETRTEALARLDRALADTVVLGVRTNIAFLRTLLADADFRAARLATDAIDKRLDELVALSEPGAAPVLAAIPAELL